MIIRFLNRWWTIRSHRVGWTDTQRMAFYLSISRSLRRMA